MVNMFRKGSWIRHPKADWGKGVVLEDSDGATLLASFEKVGLKTLTLQYVEPVLLDVPAASKEQVSQLSATARIYTDESFLDIYRDIKERFPEHRIFIENGYFFEALEADAEFLRNLYGWKIHERGGASITGVPNDAKQIWKDLKALNEPFVKVMQLPTPRSGKVERQIVEIYDRAIRTPSTTVSAEPASAGKQVDSSTACQPAVPQSDLPRKSVSVTDALAAVVLAPDFQDRQRRILSLLQEMNAKISPPPSGVWEFGGDDWFKQVGNEFDRNRHKNAKSELASLIRETLRDFKKAGDGDPSVSRVMTWTRDALPESGAFLAVAAQIIGNARSGQVVSELERAIEQYQKSGK